MHTETAMSSRAIDAEEYPVCNRCPSRILCVTIKTHLEPQGKRKSSQIQDLSLELPDLNQISETQIKFNTKIINP